jgi:hypothetical protein
MTQGFGKPVPRSSVEGLLSAIRDLSADRKLTRATVAIFALEHQPDEYDIAYSIRGRDSGGRETEMRYDLGSTALEPQPPL